MSDQSDVTRTVRLSGGPYNGHEFRIVDGEPILYLPLRSRPDLVAVYVQHDDLWKFGGFVSDESTKPFPVNLNQLVAYLTDHPRVRRYVDHLSPHEIRFLRYADGGIMWSDGIFHPITSSRSNDSEWGLEFDALGFTFALRSTRFRYEYRP